MRKNTIWPLLMVSIFGMCACQGNAPSSIDSSTSVDTSSSEDSSSTTGNDSTTYEVPPAGTTKALESTKGIIKRQETMEMPTRYRMLYQYDECFVKDGISDPDCDCHSLLETFIDEERNIGFYAYHYLDGSVEYTYYYYDEETNWTYFSYYDDAGIQNFSAYSAKDESFRRHFIYDSYIFATGFLQSLVDTNGHGYYDGTTVPLEVYTKSEDDFSFISLSVDDFDALSWRWNKKHPIKQEELPGYVEGGSGIDEVYEERRFENDLATYHLYKAEGYYVTGQGEEIYEMQREEYSFFYNEDIEIDEDELAKVINYAKENPYDIVA